MSNRKHDPKRLIAQPAPDTTFEAESFDDLGDQFTIVARKVPDGPFDRWTYTWLAEDNSRWFKALAAGTVTAATQRRSDGVVLLGKLA